MKPYRTVIEWTVFSKDRDTVKAELTSLAADGYATGEVLRNAHGEYFAIAFKTEYRFGQDNGNGKPNSE